MEKKKEGKKVGEKKTLETNKLSPEEQAFTRTADHFPSWQGQLKRASEARGVPAENFDALVEEGVTLKEREALKDLREYFARLEKRGLKLHEEDPLPQELAHARQRLSIAEAGVRVDEAHLAPLKALRAEIAEMERNAPERGATGRTEFNAAKDAYDKKKAEHGVGHSIKKLFRAESALKSEADLVRLSKELDARQAQYKDLYGKVRAHDVAVEEAAKKFKTLGITPQDEARVEAVAQEAKDLRAKIQMLEEQLKQSGLEPLIAHANFSLSGPDEAGEDGPRSRVTLRTPPSEAIEAINRMLDLAKIRGHLPAEEPTLENR